MRLERDIRRWGGDRRSTIGIGWVPLVGALSLWMFAGSACSESSGPSAGDRTTEQSNTAAGTALATFARRAEDVLAREAARRARRAAIADRLQTEGTSGGADTDERKAHRPAHRELLTWLYGRRGYRPIWHGGDRVLQRREAAEKVHRRLARGVERHGLWPDDLHLPELRRLDERARPRGVRPLEEVEIDYDQRASLRSYLREREESLEGEGSLERVARAAAKPDGPTPRLASRVGNRVAEIQKRASTVASREILLSDAVAEYLLEMKYANPAWFHDRHWRVTMRVGKYGRLLPTEDPGIGEKEPPNVTEALGSALQKARGEARAASRMAQLQDEPGDVDAAMVDSQPPYRQYERLVRAFTQYRKIVEQGGWPSIPPRAVGLSEGERSPMVENLERRLKIEGYFDGEPDRFFDRQTAEGLREYQQTHQLWKHRKLSAQSRRSLDVSAEERWHQIRVTLERWRESRIGGDSHYVSVNVPDFHGEVWRDGKREMRFRVITGRSDIRPKNPPDEEEEGGEDEEGEEGENEQKSRKPPEDRVMHRPFATPRFSDYLQYVVLNPFWNVPKSIWKQEIEPKKKENPDYYDEKGFEVVTEPNGHKFLRQDPGPENALGRVKFLFPNGHSVYMHDTPDKYLFEKPVRAFSHGCIRVEQPMKLLDYLLELDGRWEGETRKEQKEEWFDKDAESWVKLREGLPVHIEYYVVRVDDSGRANFLADIYDADEPRVEAVSERIDSLPDGYDLPIADRGELMEQALAGRFDGDDVASFSAH